MSAIKIKQALSNLNSSSLSPKNSVSNSLTSNSSIKTPINISKKSGIDNLNSINDDFALLENSFDNLQLVYERFQSILGDVENTLVTSDPSFGEDEEEQNEKFIFRYADIPFEPYLYNETKFVFNSKFDDLSLCPNVRDQLKSSNSILQKHIVRSEKFLAEFKNLFSKLSDMFNYRSLSNFSNSTISPELEEKYGVVLFYIANLAKSGLVSQKQWNDKTTSSSLTAAFPPEVEKLYSKNFSSILTFANKYCSFQSNEFIRVQSASLINFIKDLSKILHFVEHGSLDTFNLNLDFESDLLSAIGGPDVHKYFNDNDMQLGRGGAMPRKVNKKLTKLSKSVKRKAQSPTGNKNKKIEKFTQLMEAEKEINTQLTELCSSSQLELNMDFLKQFFAPFGNFFEDEHEIDSKFKTTNNSSNNHYSYDHDEIKTQTFEDFILSIDTWPTFNACLLSFFQNTTFKMIFENIYEHLVNSIWFCGKTLENSKNGISQISLKHLKFPYLLSYRDGAILLNIQEGNVSSLPMTLFMDDFCFTPYSGMLVLLGISYFQQKNAKTEEERYFHEHITSNTSPLLSNLIIIKIVDFVLYLANQALLKVETKNFTNFVVTDQKSFIEGISHVFSSVRLIEASKIDLMHRSSAIDNQNDMHSNSMWNVNFFFNFAINSVPLASFLSGDNLNKSLNKILKMMYDKNISETDCLHTGAGIFQHDLVPFRKIPEILHDRLIHLLLWIHQIEIESCFIYEYNETDFDNKPIHLSFVSAAQLEKIIDFKDKKCFFEDFFKRTTERKIHLDKKKYVISKVKIENLEQIESSNMLYLDLFNKANVYFVNENHTDYNFKLVRWEKNLHLVKSNVNFKYLLCLKQSLDDDYGCWNFSKTNFENNSFISVKYLTKEVEIPSYNCYAEHLIEKKLKFNRQIITIDKSDVYVDLNIFFQIEHDAKIYKKKLDSKEYKFYLDSNFDYDDFDKEPLEQSVCPTFPHPDLFEAGAGSRKPTRASRDKKKIKIPFRTFISINDKEQAAESKILENKDFNKPLEKNFDNSLLINITNKNLEKFRDLLIKIEIIIMDSCKILKTNAEIKLLEMIALKHFKQYPHLYVMCSEFKSLTPFYPYFEDVYVNNFCVNIEELEKLLKSTHNFSDHLLKFKEHYSFFCLRSLPLHKFGNVVKAERGSCFFHLMALYIIHSQLKLAGDPAYSLVSV